jgi:hypothetical protein
LPLNLKSGKCIAYINFVQAPFSKKRIKFAAEAVATCTAYKVIPRIREEDAVEIIKENYRCEGKK